MNICVNSRKCDYYGALMFIPASVPSMEEGHREPPIGLSWPTHQGMSGANRGQVACI